MPRYRTRLDVQSYPGAGTQLTCDPRRRNAWLGDRGATMAAGAPGLALATVAISLRSETAGAAPPPLDTALARLATVLGSVFEERPAALDVVARCFGAPSAWVALDRQLAHAGPATVAEASEVVADAQVAAKHGLVELTLDVVDGASSASGQGPRLSAMDLCPALALAPARVLRALMGELGVSTAPPVGLPSARAASPAFGTAASSSSGGGGGGSSSGGSSAGGSGSSEALAQQLCLVLSRRRRFDASPMLRVLGPCARMPHAVASSIHQLCVAHFGAAHFGPEEAATMLCGTGGLTPSTRFGAAATIAAQPASLAPRFGTPVVFRRYLASLELLARAEASATGEGGGGSGRDAPGLLAAHAEALAMLLGGGDGRSPAMCGVLGRIITAGCAQLRRQGQHGASAHALSDAVGHPMMPARWRAASFVQCAKDFERAKQPDRACRLCELANASDGWLSGAAVAAAAEGRGAEGGGGGAASDSFRLGAAQLIGVRRQLKKLAVAPRRWKRPSLPSLTEPREVRLRGREVLEFGDSGRRLGWETTASGANAAVAAGVEEFVLAHYLRNGASGAAVNWSHGVHLENSITLSLFALLMWDAIFAPLPAAFGSTSQDAPDDLLSGGRGAFAARRAALVDSLLAAIEAAPSDDDAAGDNKKGPGSSAEPAGVSLAARLAASHAAHHGEQCIGLDWERLDLLLLQLAARALGGRVVAAICRALADDYLGFSHGAPDLLLLAEAGRVGDGSQPAAVARARFVEVKGPGDRLSDAQRAWIDVLASAGADVEVAYVERL